MRTLLVAVLCAASAPAPATSTPGAILLPGGPGPVAMDYIAAERAPARIWLPAGYTGNVDVVEVSTGKVTAVSGFATGTMSTKRGEKKVGPSSVTLAEGFAYIGDRADNSVCAVDRMTLVKGACLKIDTMPDGLAYVPNTKQVWITTPRSQSLTVLAARAGGTLTAVGSISIAGKPEGVAVDSGKGLFFTNLEDQDQTLAFDVTTRKEVARISPQCGEEGPSGISVDEATHMVFVACHDSVTAIDWSGKPHVVASVKTAVGLDNIDYVPERHELFAAGGQSGTLTIARFAGSKFEVLATLPTSPGVRAVVGTADGVAFAADAQGGRVLQLARAAANR